MHAHDVTVAFVTHDHSHTCLANSAEDGLQCHCRLGEHVGGPRRRDGAKSAPWCTCMQHALARGQGGHAWHLGDSVTSHQCCIALPAQSGLAQLRGSSQRVEQ